MTYIAVLVEDLTKEYSERQSYGDYSCFIGKNKELVISRALVAQESWGNEKYHVFVGVLKEKASRKTEYALRKLEEK